MARYVTLKDDFDPATTCGLCGGPLNEDGDTAAPELLRLLQTILDVWDEHKIIGPTTYHDSRAAIAKATGN